MGEEEGSGNGGKLAGWEVGWEVGFMGMCFVKLILGGITVVMCFEIVDLCFLRRCNWFDSMLSVCFMDYGIWSFFY